MKKHILLLSAFLYCVITFAQNPIYYRVKINTPGTEIETIARLGIPLEEGIHKKGDYFITDISENEIIKLRDSEIFYEVLIEDVAKYYVDQNIGKSSNINDYKSPGDYEVPDNFEFGSMSGHATYDEIVQHLDNMLNLFPDLISVKESIGQTIEGREMWMVKISDNPNSNEEEPEVLYNALTHAREPAGVMTLLFYMFYLLENYETDAFIQALVDNTEMYFVPVVNPDGYVYNETNSPNGGGMWRKNRRDNGDGTWGVDLNRNYGYMWGYDNVGSSPDPGSETYRGTEAFSEPEIQNIRDFCENHEFKTSINYHTYGSLLLYAWDYDYIVCPDDAILNALGQLMISDNNYDLSQGIYLYAMNGSANDWQYGEQTTKEKMFSYLPELGTGNDGFWCPIDRIIPIAQENMIQNLLLAAFAGFYADVEDLSSTITSETSSYINFNIIRLGLMDGGIYTVSLEPISNSIISVGAPRIFENMEILESRIDSIEIELNPEIQDGTPFQLLLSVDNGDFVLSDTLTKIFGESQIIFEDNGDDMSNWSSSQWDVTTSSYYSPPKSITDSPGGNYSNGQTNYITMSDEINLSAAVYAQLNFWAKWEIEQGWDFVQLMISENGSTSWTPLEGKYTVTGNGNQVLGEPLYGGFQTDWVEEEINLTEYIGSTIRFLFMLKSDNSTTEDGFYFDDFTLSIIETGGTGDSELEDARENLFISYPIPNPSNENVKFNLELLELYENISFVIYNTSGQKIHSERLHIGQESYELNVKSWKEGIYYYNIKGNEINTGARKLIIIH